MMSLETAGVETGSNAIESNDLMPPEPPQNPLPEGIAPTHMLSVTCKLPPPVAPNSLIASASPDPT
jgi:hypothetical protein